MAKNTSNTSQTGQDQDKETASKPKLSQEQESAAQAVDILEDTKQSLEILLKDKHEVVLIGMRSKINLMQNQLRMLSGSMVHADMRVEHKPVTEFMGDPIKKQMGESVRSEDLSPKELEIKNLVDKTDKLQSAFPTLKNEQILDSYRNDDKPIRLLAKRAGLEDYKEANINGEYLDLIRNGFEEQEKQAALKQRDKDEIDNQQ